MTYEVAGKTAVITGAASGIGLGMAKAFARAGMNLVLADVDGERLDEAVAICAAIGVGAIGVAADVAEPAQVEQIAERTLSEFGSVHVVSNNAGVGISGPVDEMSLDDWRWIIDVNLWGVIHGVRTFLPLLRAQGEGHLTATASMAGLAGGPMLGAYHVAKHGVVGLMDSVRAELELAGSPVRASVLCPGPVDTAVVGSERHRHPDSQRHERGESEQRFWDGLVSALASGMNPDVVGELVLSAVEQERFWILTEPNEHVTMVQHRLDAIRADNDLSG